MGVIEPHRVDEIQVDFEWHPGFSPVQKKKNIVELHEASKKKGLYPLLEISTKSDELLGKRLSAFNLKIETDMGEISVEAAFQGSKVFEQGGPFTDIEFNPQKSINCQARTVALLVEYSGANRPPIPVEAGHPFRLKAATHSGESGHP